MQILVKLNTSGSDTGPFMVYSNLNNYEAPAYGPYTKAQLLTGVTITVPDATTDVRIRSNGKCTNSIFLTLPTTTSTTTTCAPQNFTIQASGLTSITFTNFSALTEIKIIWQTGVVETWHPGDPVPSHTYSSPYTGDIILQSCNLENIQILNIENTNPQGIAPSTATLTIKDTELTKLTGLQQCNVYSPYVIVSAAGGLTSSTSLLPRGLIYFWANQNNMTGNVSSLPSGLLQFFCAGQNTLNGVVANIPSGIQYFEVTGLNTISGLISDMPLSTISFTVFGFNTIGGLLSGIPGGENNPNLQYFNILGRNTIHGDVGDMNWRKIKLFNLAGPQNQPTAATTSYLTGDLDDRVTMPAISVLDGGDGVRPFRLDLQVFGHVFGYNTITGNINNFPPNMFEISVTGEDQFSLGYGNTLSGNLTDLPKTNMHTLYIGGRNTITGAISSYAPSNTTVDTFAITGLNTLSGNLSNLPLNVRRVDIQGGNTISAYSPIRTWQAGPTPPYGGTAGSMAYFVFNSSSTGKLNIQAEVSQLVIDLNNNPTWQNYGTIQSDVKIRGTLPLTAPGITALAALSLKVQAASGNTANVIP